MKRASFALMLVVVGMTCVAAQATTVWTGNTQYTGWGDLYKGPDQSFTSVKPVTGDWTANYVTFVGAGSGTGGASDPSAPNSTINIWSAANQNLDVWYTHPNNNNASGQMVFKITLSEPIKAFSWNIFNGMAVSCGSDAGVNPQARWSVDGTNWNLANQYPVGSSSAQTINVDLASTPTSTLYIGMFTEIYWGGPWCYYEMKHTGPMTFTPVPEPVTALTLAGLGIMGLRRRLF
jgi:hypothetical protein